MRLRIKSGYGGWEKNQTSAASEESTWGETRETGVGEDKEEATHVATKSECRHAEFINIFNKNLGISYTLLTNSGTPSYLYPSLPPSHSTNKSRALPSASFSWTVKAMLIFWNNRRTPFCRLRGGLSRFLYTETYLISIPVAPKLMAMDRLLTYTAMAPSF